MPWTSEEISLNSWTHTARSSVLQHVLTINRTWGMRWVTTEYTHKLVVHRYKVLFTMFAVLYVKSPWWSFLSVLIPGVSGECTAAGPDRAFDAPPPAAVSPGHTEDRKWRGESAHESERVEGSQWQHDISEWSMATAGLLLVIYYSIFFVDNHSYTVQC